MTFFRIVRDCLGRPREGLLDHAESIAVLIQNIILSPAPLYRVGEWVRPMSAEALGLSEAQKNAINDDRIARALDALVSSRARSLFFRLALHIIKSFEVDTSRVHHDTTTVTFHGAYASSVREPKITYGINKDHRPDLKQLVFGLNVSADGAVPLSHQVHSGNRTDDTIHSNNIEELRRLLKRDDFVYVADSKLCTRKNLHQIDTYDGKFVTVMPRTRAEDKLFRKQLREGHAVRWRRLLTLPNNRRRNDPPDVYYSTNDGPNQTSEGYRIVWCRSSQKANQDENTRENQLQKTEAALVELDSRLNRRQLRRRANINKAVKKILRSFHCERFLKVTIATQTQTETKRLRPGRPGKNDPVRVLRRRTYRLKFRRDDKALRAEARTNGVFPLVSNLEGKRAGKRNVLTIYKYQPYVEKRHALLKSELEVAPAYLKKPSRVVGLIHANFLAMTVDALIERTVRTAMRCQGIESLPLLPEGRHTKTPTTARVLEMFRDVAWYQFDRKDEVVTFPIRLSPVQKEILGLLGMDPSSYA